jgi:hypothetical protein
MEFEIFNNKKINNGKIDMLSTYCKFNYEKIAIKDWVLIDEGSNTSIDLISTVAYGRPDYLDLLIKFNRLNNPLYLPTNTLVVVPELQSMLDNLEYIDLSAISTKITSNQLSSYKRTISTSPGTKPIEASNYTKTSSGAYIF